MFEFSKVFCGWKIIFDLFTNLVLFFFQKRLKVFFGIISIRYFSGIFQIADVSAMPPLKGDEEVKEGKGLKILTPNKLLTRLPVLLA